MASNRIQMLGINSGMDTESIVNALLQPYQNKIDVQYKKQTKLEWKQEAWKDLNTKISSFFDNYVSKLKKSTTFKGNKVTNTNESCIKVNTNSSVVPTGVHKFEVKQLASTAYMQNSAMTNSSILSDKMLSNANASTMTLGDLGLSEPTTFKIAQKDASGTAIDPPATFTVNESMTVADLQNTLSRYNVELSIDDTKGSFSLKYTGATMVDKESLTVSVDSGDTSFLSDIGLESTTFNKSTIEKSGKALNTFSTSTTLSRLGIGSGKITLNGHTIEVNGSMKLSELESALKSADSSLNVTLDVGQKRFFISTKDTGSDKSIAISDNQGGSLLSQLGLAHSLDANSSDVESSSTSGDVTTYHYKDGTTVSYNQVTKAVEIKGATAKYTYNGMDYESESNNISINGINATLLSTTPAGQTTNITSANDPSEVSNFLKEFVSEYNKLIDEINTLITTKPSKKYEPLTKAQRDEMDEDQIEKWEKLAKQGLFYQDDDLISIRDTMRNILGSAVSGTESKTLYSIGITTGSWSENGKLYFDEEAFAKAYEENPDDVIKMLTGSGSQTQAVEDYMRKNPGATEADFDLLTDSQKATYYDNTKGIAYRLYDSMNKLIYSSSLNKTYGKVYNDKVMTKELKEIENRVDELQKRYDRMETLYYKKFTAMEKALSSMNTQSNWLTSALG